MKIKEIEAFIAVVEEGGVVKAAEKMFCVTSNVSKLINDLEVKCQQPLFYRVSRELSITPYGRYFYDQAKILIQHTQHFTETMFDSLNAKLLIGGIDVALDYFLPEHIYQFKMQNKMIDFELYRGYSSTLEHKLDTQQYDLIFSDGPLTSPRLNSKLVFFEKLVLVQNSDLIERNQIIYSYGDQCSYKTYIKDWASKNLHDFRIVVIESYPLILNLVKNGMGKSMVPVSVMEQHPNFQHLIDSTQSIDCNIHMIWNKFNQSKQMKDFLNHFKSIHDN